MADRETADRRRGTPQGSPSFTFQPRKDFVGDRQRTCRQTMTCSPRCGSGPKGLPFSSELSDGGGVHDHHDEDGNSSNLSSNPSSPEKTQKIFADRQSGASDGLWSRSWVNPQVGGLITSVMSPIITSRQASRNRPTDKPPWTPEAASPQVGGLITLARGVHHARTASTPAELSTMNRTTTLRSNCSLSPSARITPVEPTAAERRPECPAAHRAAGHLPSPPWWGRHMACPQRQRAFAIANAGSPCLRDGCATFSSPPGRRERHCSEPVGLTLQSSFARIPLALRVDEAVTEAESKMDDHLW
jgi:hypothetical protein